MARVADSVVGVTGPSEVAEKRAVNPSLRGLLAESGKGWRSEQVKPLRAPVPTRPEDPFSVSAGMGLVLTDASLMPLYVNKQALRILTYPENPETIKNVGRVLQEKVRALFSQQFTAPALTPMFTEFVSWRRSYFCRALSLELPSMGPLQPAIALLLERRDAGSVDLLRIEDHYRLTMREREAVEWLMRGLTGKEIAARMRISPNTVKTLIHLVMIKIGVSTRAGIIAHILNPAVTAIPTDPNGLADATHPSRTDRRTAAIAAPGRRSTSGRLSPAIGY